MLNDIGMKIENVPILGWIASRYRAVVRAFFATPRRLASIDVQLKIARMKDQVFTFPYGEHEVKMFLPYAGQDLIQTQIVDVGTFWESSQLELIAAYLKHGAIVVDCGANIGNHTLYFTKICGAGKVFAFEPQSKCAEIMKRNLELNGVIECVDIQQVVLGAKSGRASVSHREAGNVGGTAFACTDNGDYEVKTLDEYGFTKLDLLKIDAEGAHYEVLLGAKETLDRCSPAIWIEMFSESKERDNFDYEHEVRLPQEFLNSAGYKLKKKLSEVDYLYVKNDDSERKV